MIKIEHLNKSYGDNLVLNNINLTFNACETVALIGPSGSGKSTLLRCIINLEQPSSGKIHIDGVASTATESFSKIGMVFQHFNLFPHLNVIDNLCFAPINVKKQNPEQARSEAFELLAKIGLADKATSTPKDLSGGQKQRVAIARTLMMRPQIILFDEPTSALDPETVKEVLELIKSLATTNITILIVTHEMSFAREIAKRVLFFDQGKIIEDSSADQFFSDPQTMRAQLFLNKSY